MLNRSGTAVKSPASCNVRRLPLRHAPGVALRCAIVDDNPEFLEAARNLLERQGMAVVGLVSSADEAVERVNELTPDVALVDLDLRGASGFELARRIANTPVILISAYDEDDFAELVDDTPAAGFLSKTQLSRRAISDLLDGR
jgi:DNA-binding NarL/FixJ family response regulator